MSAIVGPSPVLESPPPPTAGRLGVRPWLATGMAVVLLALAGGVRLWQGEKVASRMESGKASPFPLKDIPKQIGPWRATDDPGLDPAIARGTGSTDSINRIYVDDRTGVRLAVLVLYGPAMAMQIHAPEKCYPAVGYFQMGSANQHTTTYQERDGSRGTADLRSLTYGKGDGPAADRKQVTYTWGCQGRWTPDLPNIKSFHRIPGMFKVHLDRPSGVGESSEFDAPAEAFIRELLPVIDARVQSAAKVAASPSAAASR